MKILWLPLFLVQIALLAVASVASAKPSSTSDSNSALQANPLDALPSDTLLNGHRADKKQHSSGDQSLQQPQLGAPAGSRDSRSRKNHGSSGAQVNCVAD